MKKTFLVTWHMFICIVFVSVLSTGLISCDSDPEDEEMVAATAEVSVPNGCENYFIEDLYFTRLADEVKVVFQINVDWTLVVTDENGGFVSWCNVSLTSGEAGLHKVLVRVTENKSSAARTAKIQLLSGMSKVADIIVTQEKDSRYVDLGLSVIWASCNVGADSPEEYGGYYAWGETEEKAKYDWTTYKWCNGTEHSLSKYCYNRYEGTVDNKRTLDPKDDVAHVKWGSGWRMPTLNEAKELVDKCSWVKTSVNGVKGCKVIGPNGNSIFFPNTGTVYGPGKNDSESISLWTNTLCGQKSNCVITFGFYQTGDTYSDCHSARRYGHCVRPVTDY